MRRGSFENFLCFIEPGATQIEKLETMAGAPGYRVVQQNSGFARLQRLQV